MSDKVFQETSNKQKHCWFCAGEKEPADPESAYEAVMQRFPKHLNTIEKDVVNVPRCLKCKKNHGRERRMSLPSILIGFAAAVLIAEGLFDAYSNWIKAVILFSFAAIIGLSGIVWSSKRWERKYGNITRSYSYNREYPIVKQRIKQGWKVL
ncbi:MAG: hypothetical protein ACYS83_10355 [Planctomycetota bacterium]|jgi:hypothetical protein